MDTFMNIDHTYKILRDKYLSYGKIIVAYDFDDTVRMFRATSCEDVRQLIRDIRPYAHLICYTARGNDDIDMVKDYLIKNNIPFDHINKEYDGSEIRGKKIYYNIFLDDKCGLYEPYLMLSRFLEEFGK